MYQIFVGLDVSKTSFAACAIGREQGKIFEFSVPINMEGFGRLTEHLSQFPKESILIGMESSGCYHINLSSFLCDNDYNTVVINPLLISNFTKLSLRKTKTDRKDAFAIARFLAMFPDSLPQSSFLSPDFRELTRERERLSSEIARLKNDIEKLLSITFPELLRATNVYSKAILSLLKYYPSAWMLKSLPTSEIAKLLKPNTSGRKTQISPEELVSLAKNSIASMSPVREFILSQKASQLLLFDEELKRLTNMLAKMCRECALIKDMEVLKSIKGIGDVTALHFLAEAGDVSRFENYKKLIAYAGLDPTVYQSGKFEGQSRISKRGNRHLRRVLWLMATKVARYNQVFREYFLRRRAEGISYKKAILTVAHKLIRVIFAMLTHKTCFLAGENSL